MPIALTRGRLEKATVKLLEECGHGIESLKGKERALVFQDFKRDIRYFLMKSNDCIIHIQHDATGTGVVGKDTPLEGGKDYYEISDLDIGKRKFIVAGLREYNLFDKMGYMKMGTRYPNIAKQYFLGKGMDAECIKIDGSVEPVPILGLRDGVVGIIKTETTLREGGLAVFDTVYDIGARVIVSKASFKLKRAEILAILEDMKRGLGAC